MKTGQCGGRSCPSAIGSAQPDHLLCSAGRTRKICIFLSFRTLAANSSAPGRPSAASLSQEIKSGRNVQAGRPAGVENPARALHISVKLTRPGVALALGVGLALGAGLACSVALARGYQKLPSKGRQMYNF